MSCCPKVTHRSRVCTGGDRQSNRLLWRCPIPIIHETAFWETRRSRGTITRQRGFSTSGPTAGNPRREIPSSVALLHPPVFKTRRDASISPATAVAVDFQSLFPIPSTTYRKNSPNPTPAHATFKPRPSFSSGTHSPIRRKSQKRRIPQARIGYVFSNRPPGALHFQPSPPVRHAARNHPQSRCNQTTYQKNGSAFSNCPKPLHSPPHTSASQTPVPICQTNTSGSGFRPTPLPANREREQTT